MYPEKCKNTSGFPNLNGDVRTLEKKPQKTTALHPVSFYGNVEGGYPNCHRARDVIRPGEVVISGPPVSTLEPTTFLL